MTLDEMTVDQLHEATVAKLRTHVRDVAQLRRAIEMARLWEKRMKRAEMPLVALVTLFDFVPEPSVLVKSQLFWDIVSGIDVLRVRDGFALSDVQILERAANMMSGLIGNYKFTPL